MKRLRQEELEDVLDAIENGTQTVHISGQPGVGKSTFLKELANRLSESYNTRMLHVNKGSSPTTLTQDLLTEVRDAVGTIRALINSVTGISVGGSVAGMGLSGGLTVDDQSRPLEKLAEVSDSIPAHKSLILLIDDVHKLGSPDITRAFLQDLSEKVGENVHIVSAGRLIFEEADHHIRLGTFTHEQTAEYLQQKFSSIDTDTIESLYQKLEGHPYYLELLTEAETSESNFEIPEEDIRDFLENRYLDSMSEEEEQFIRETSGLAELDEEICAAVLDEVSRTRSRRILNSLGDKAVVTELGRSEVTGDRVYKVHDLFQEFLHQKLKNPEDFHRRAFQYYAEKLYDAVKESEVPPVEGFVFALMANVHLNEVYDNNPTTAQIRTEVDALGLDPSERLQFMFGYSPYTPISQDESAAIMSRELDSYTEFLRGLEPEDDEERLELTILTVMMDLLRANQRPDSTSGFDESSSEIYQSVLKRIEEANIESYFDPKQEEAAQMIPDLLRMCTHVAAYRDAEDENVQQAHLRDTYELLEGYGLNQEVVEEFMEKCHRLTEEYEAGKRVEEMVDSQMEEFFNQFDDGDITRNTLIQMQSGLISELMTLANSALTAAISESDRLLEFIHDCGETLEKADNPFFVAAWYSTAVHVYGMFAPASETTKELEEVYQRHAASRRVYEKEAENVCYEIEEFDVTELDFPGIVNEIAETDKQN